MHTSFELEEADDDLKAAQNRCSRRLRALNDPQLELTLDQELRVVFLFPLFGLVENSPVERALERWCRQSGRR